MQRSRLCNKGCGRPVAFKAVGSSYRPIDPATGARHVCSVPVKCDKCGDKFKATSGAERCNACKDKDRVIKTRLRPPPFATQANKPDSVVDESDDEPKPNSPEDLGLGLRLPPATSNTDLGQLPVNHSTNAIQAEDARKFVAWVMDSGLSVQAEITVGRALVEFSGLGRPDLKWLCQAIKQAGRVPDPKIMRRAVIQRDVNILFYYCDM